ncbi:galactosylceramide sulfotransferase-like [Saccoglossus kowalevskii]|uniref:Galactosylceramide sulfotransferase-like n=1 Tax=Saccoglossus kowalevskii TaxID=10224 RepID=A0ABM0GXE1_SACKO|nr:PREDICTED: galactosylceramide sulfotransferase-like [Saccoglossus kowalevskii]
MAGAQTKRHLHLILMYCACCLLLFAVFSSHFIELRPRALVSLVQKNETTPLFSHDDTCKPVQQIVFLKTHKTASTTSNTIIQRYAYFNNLTFALPYIGGKFCFYQLFNRRMVSNPKFEFDPGSAASVFNILANHARFSRTEMDVVVPQATYLTILRNPIARFESVFGYYRIDEELKLDKYSNPIEAFFEKPDYYFNRRPSMYFQLKNGMMYSLGLDHRFHDNTTRVLEKIEQLDREFDLFMMTEYFDESLVLMKKILCWDTDSMMYLPKGLRKESRRFNLTDEMKAKIRAWNAADVMLYNHFNKSFWRKVKEYGDNFQEDLQNLQEAEKQVYETCIDADRRPRGYLDPRESFLSLRKNASELCRILYKRVDYFVNHARVKQDTPPAPRGRYGYSCRDTTPPLSVQKL